MRPLLLPLAALCLIACSETERVPPKPIDAGIDRDAGPTADAGPIDGGDVLDGGVTDAGMDRDGGAQDAAVSDGGADDAGANDASADGGTDDAGNNDGGADDAGNNDGGANDAGPRDGGADDSGVNDGGVPDAGVADAGGMPDAGMPDAGTPDGGVGPTCDPNFGAANSCGGVPIGSWNYAGVCSDLVPYADLRAQCPAAVVTNVTRAASGTLDILANGTFMRNLTTTTTGDVFVPSACVPAVPCSGVGLAFSLLQPGGTATCVNATGGCNCAATVVDVLQDSGTIAINGTIATTVSGGQTRNYWYCTQAASFTYRGLPANQTDNENVYVLTP